MNDNQSAANANHGIAILRIKRRRDEEPLDALVVESGNRRKRTKGGPGVFQYADTVEDRAWCDEEKQREIQEKLSRLAMQAATKTDWKANAPGTPDRESPLMRRQESGAAKRYTIIEAEAPLSPTKLPTSPPVVVASKDLTAQDTTPDFKMYDAVLATPAEDTEIDPEMEKFQTMLNDYLRVHDVDLSSPQKQTDAKTGMSLDTVMTSPNAEKGDYVWDVFYHRPATLAEWNEIAANIGTLYGYPSEDDDYSTGSESELEDIVDEDSNDEGYYKNDYPDEEEDYSSDEFHESSEAEDVLHYDEGGNLSY